MIPVDREIYDGVAKIAGSDYAFSYLIKATQDGRKVIPHTVTAWERLRDRADVNWLFHQEGWELVKPKTWSPDRDGVRPPMEMAEIKRR